MTDECKQTYDAVIARLAEHAAKLFAEDAARRSVMLAVAQYWDDNANDEVHGTIVASARHTPVWPHECDTEEDENGEWQTAPVLAGEECWHCSGGRDIEIDFYGGWGDGMVVAFEQFCREAAHQGMEKGEAYVPFAIARRVDDRVEVERIGRPQRVPTQRIGSTPGGPAWPDARARELFAEVCLHAADDGPRAVLADYLLENHPDDPRGEAIALALATDLDADARARRDALFATHGERWLYPLGDVIVAGCARFERGFLAHADIHAQSAHERDRVVGAPAWGTVHTVRFAPESLDVIGPAMTALRDVGPIRDDGLRALQLATRPWPIETLRVAASANLAPLLATATLPGLARLELATAFRESLPRLRGAPWFAQLEQLVIVDREYTWLLDARVLRERLGVRELVLASAAECGEIAAGWELGFRADDSVSVRATEWHASQTIGRLAELLGRLPAGTRVELVSTHVRAFTVDDVRCLDERTGGQLQVVDK